MYISLIICTRDHCDQLVRCLNSIQGIVFDQPWELIVVDNGSIDETRSVVREFISIIPISTLYIFEQNPGKSNALNTAIKTARGEILAFTDDDCEPASDFLAQIWSAFNDPAVGFIGGRIVERDPADHSIMVGGPTIPRTLPARSFIAAGVVQGGNMAFRQTVLREIGGFDPLFGPGRFLAGEDCWWEKIGVGLFQDIFGLPAVYFQV